MLVLAMSLVTLDHRGGDGGLVDGLRSTTQAAAAPLQRGVSAVARPIRGAFASIRDLGTLRERNEELQADVTRLSGQIRYARELERENAELREHLALKRSWRGAERITAQVISDSPGNYRWAVVIDKGSTDGVRRDMPVLVPDGLVGRVLRVEPHQATVLLVVDPAAGVAARVEEGSAWGVVTGNGGGRPLSFSFVDKSGAVAVGDGVVTSNLNRGIFPSGIPVGVVTSVEGDERDVAYEIEVEPVVDPGSLNLVEVLLLAAPPLEGLATP